MDLSDMYVNITVDHGRWKGSDESSYYHALLGDAVFCFPNCVSINVDTTEGQS